VADEKKLFETDPDEIFDEFFGDTERAAKTLQMVSFQAFADTADAVTAATASMEGKVSKSLKSFLKKKFLKKAGVASSAQLAVADKGIASSLKESGVSQVVHDSRTQGKSLSCSIL